jgi:DNA/RNA endonuclease YhcR with UshA esterase domain
LPDEETAEMMVKIKGFDDLPDDVKNDKEKIREILTQQQAQKEHEKRVIQEQMKYLKEFDEQNELAIERGDEPQKLNVVQMMTQINEDLGRELEKTPEEVAETVQGNEDMLLKALTGAAPKPGSKASKLKKWFERITQPLPDLSPLWDRIGGVRSSFRGDVMAKRRVKAVRRTQALLDSVAETLEERGALKLSRLVDAEASGLPEADKLPDGEKAKIWDEDWTQQTSDYREDLGFPPYDEARPKVKGDDAAD